MSFKIFGMQLLKRIGYFLVGLAFGSVALFFFWKQKNVEFDYLPNARTLKNIRVKPRLFSKEATLTMQQNEIDSIIIANILIYGEVDFGKSKPRQKPCREYWVDSENLETQISLVVKNCDSTATIQKVFVN